MVRLKTLLITFATFASGSAFGQSGGDSGVDNVLERLEKQILNDEADGFSHPGLKSENDSDSLQDHTAPIGGVSAKKAKTSDPAPDFSRILDQVKTLEKEIDRLSSDVHEYKQAAIVTSKDNTYVYLEANMLEGAKGSLRSIKVTVDGFTVYHVKDTAGLWLPNSAIPLYSGPLSAGSHKIEVDAHIGQVSGPGLPVSGPIYKAVEKSFEVQVPLTSASKKYVLSIGSVSGQGDDPSITLKDSL